MDEILLLFMKMRRRTRRLMGWKGGPRAERGTMALPSKGETTPQTGWVFTLAG